MVKPLPMSFIFLCFYRACFSNITCFVDAMPYVDNFINSIVVSCMDIKTTILSLKNSSPGYDELPISIAKQCIDNYVMLLI